MELNKRKIILCVDNSEASSNTVEFFIDYIANKNDEVHIISVFDPPSLKVLIAYSGPFVVPDDYEMKISKEVELQKKVLHDYKIKIENNTKSKELNLNLICKLINPNDMEVGPTLIVYSKEIKADFIIVGSRGSNFIKRIFMGSVSTYLMHNSKSIPVIIGPRPQKK